MIRGILCSIKSIEKKLIKLEGITERKKARYDMLRLRKKKKEPNPFKKEIREIKIKAKRFRKELIKLRKYPGYLEKATKKNSGLRKEIIELSRANRGLNRWYDIIDSHGCKTKAALERRLEKSVAKSFGKWLEDAKEKYKLMYQGIKEGRTQGYILEKVFKRKSSPGSSAFIKGLVGALMHHGLVIFSNGRGAERVYSLKPFDIVHEKVDPHIGLKMKIIYPENYKDMKKLLEILKTADTIRGGNRVAIRGKTKEQICKAFSKELFDNTIEELIGHACCGVRTDKNGLARYFTRTSTYEFDCRVLKKDITGKNLMGVKRKLIQFLKDNPGSTVDEIAEWIYGDKGKRSRLKAYSAVAGIKHLLRLERSESRNKWFLDDKLVTEEHVKERGET